MECKKVHDMNMKKILKYVTLRNNRPTWCHLLLYFTSYVLNVFRTLIYPSSGALRLFCWITTLVVLFLVRCVLAIRCGWFGVVSVLQAEAEIQQNSRKLLMMDILMSETLWTHKKWNYIAGDIKLVFYSSTVTTMHGPINIKFMVFFGTINNREGN